MDYYYQKIKLPLHWIVLKYLHLIKNSLFFEEEEELEQNNGIMVMEWPEKITSVVDEYLLIEIKYAEVSSRILEIYDPYNLRKS